MSSVRVKDSGVEMNKPVIQRYISDEDSFLNICTDFGFLVEKIKKFMFEYTLEIRHDYFNLYYQGNSIGKIAYYPSKRLYEISINKKFLEKGIIKQFGGKPKKSYVFFDVSPKKLPSFFSDRNLKTLSQKVRDVNYQEELGFEQILMTDNVCRDDFIIIDRQVVDHTSRDKFDLLALKKVEGNNFQFCILEVKLGNNPELKGDVSRQLKGYIERIENNFEDYKKCYEMNFEQKKKLGLVEEPKIISIVRGVVGVVVVGGYSGIAKESINVLKSKDKEIRVLQFSNKIDFREIK